MGYYVIAFCEISFKNMIEEPLKKKIRSLIKKSEEDSKNTITNLKFSKYFVEFELGGNKGVDYEVLDKIKELLLTQRCIFQISANEFVESDSGGYYFDSEDED